MNRLIQKLLSITSGKETLSMMSVPMSDIIPRLPRYPLDKKAVLLRLSRAL